MSFHLEPVPIYPQSEPFLIVFPYEYHPIKRLFLESLVGVKAYLTLQEVAEVAGHQSLEVEVVVGEEDLP